jgi:hypothetical protein
MSMPRTSRRPSPLTPSVTITATETMRPFSRAFVGRIYRYGQSLQIGRIREAFTFASISSRGLETWLLEIRSCPGQIVDRVAREAGHIGLLHNRGERLLGNPTRLPLRKPLGGNPIMSKKKIGVRGPA